MQREPEPELMDDVAEAEAYAKADFASVNQAFVDRLVELADRDGPADAVDLGTGPGDIPIRLLHHRPAWRIVAVDASEAMLALARLAAAQARVGQSIRWHVADAKDTGLPAVSFDVIFSNSILHHITGVDRFWAELRRLARPGATALLRDLARPESPQAARQIVQRYAAEESPLLQDEYYRSLLSAYTVQEVRGQLDRAGLSGLAVAMVTDRHMDILGRID